jgi:hypothetical protein
MFYSKVAFALVAAILVAPLSANDSEVSGMWMDLETLPKWPRLFGDERKKDWRGGERSTGCVSLEWTLWISLARSIAAISFLLRDGHAGVATFG